MNQSLETMIQQVSIQTVYKKVLFNQRWNWVLFDLQKQYIRSCSGRFCFPEFWLSLCYFCLVFWRACLNWEITYCSFYRLRQEFNISVYRGDKETDAFNAAASLSGPDRRSVDSLIKDFHFPFVIMTQAVSQRYQSETQCKHNTL